jgi:hypothetical protein
VSTPFPAAVLNFLTAKLYHVLIMKKREKRIPFVWLEVANTWVCPALKEER